MAAISEEQQEKIKALTMQGVTVREIAKQLSLSVGAVSKYRQQIEDRPKPNRGGRPSSLSEADCDAITRGIEDGEFRNASDAARKLSHKGIHVSSETVRRVLRKRGFQAMMLPKYLNPHHIREVREAREEHAQQERKKNIRVKKEDDGRKVRKQTVTKRRQQPARVKKEVKVKIEEP
ncbi:hypothetical protein DFQ28_009990 [Apophysomyces sp. BC1034]|nr:hypothetical protein DFQ30_009654 [Apophysomyces sp. BC1015]KAG0173947.1 hypothetical protein DFQ29_007672 [Apophysomyces sp. BC1021]KAG0185070.1 hypothetical protein DFQ28_009990 [Apophysomyces sp. BC1034]